MQSTEATSHDAVRDTKTAKRREVTYKTLEEIEREVERIANEQTTVTGNWSEGQILQHLARTFQMSFEGATFKLPLFIRIMAGFMKNKWLKGPMPAGFQLPADNPLRPNNRVSREEGAREMQQIFARLARGEKMTQRSPAFGKMTHEDWIRLHLIHCGLHLSFIHFADSAQQPA